MVEPVASQLVDEIRVQAAEALQLARSQIVLEPLGESKNVADATSKFMVWSTTREPLAVALCSSSLEPEIVARGAEGARLAGRALGPELGRAALVPISDGWVRGLSFAIVPFAHQFSSRKLLLRCQRALLRPVLLRWLRGVATVTQREIAGDEGIDGCRSALNDVAGREKMATPIRHAADIALKRIDDRSWKPKHVLMHGDLWIGNILIDPRENDRRWAERFVIIDWPGVTIDGYPIYDLVRVAHSFRCSARSLRHELKRHAEVLSCDPEDTLCYLIAALGHIGMHLEFFPVERYLRMSEDCFNQLKAALP